jgi:uncharacterized protein (DUF736 family)
LFREKNTLNGIPRWRLVWQSLDSGAAWEMLTKPNAQFNYGIKNGDPEGKNCRITTEGRYVTGLEIN